MTHMPALLPSEACRACTDVTQVESRAQKGPACHVEGIEGHLRRGLAHALGGQNTDCLPWSSQALQELEVHQLREALGAPRQQLRRLLPNLLLPLRCTSHLTLSSQLRLPAGRADTD